MKPFSKILVPYDFSAPAEDALAIAADLARRYEASVSVLNVHEPRLVASPEAYLLYQSDELQGLIAELEAEITAVGQKLAAAGVMQVETRVRPGVPGDEILRESVEGKYDLIVMATHGRSGFSHALLGSVAERVVRAASCPVLTVRLRKPTASRGA